MQGGHGQGLVVVPSWAARRQEGGDGSASVPQHKVKAHGQLFVGPLVDGCKPGRVS